MGNSSVRPVAHRHEEDLQLQRQGLRRSIPAPGVFLEALGHGHPGKQPATGSLSVLPLQLELHPPRPLLIVKVGIQVYAPEVERSDLWNQEGGLSSLRL